MVEKNGESFFFTSDSPNGPINGQKRVATRAVVHCLGAWAAMDVALISVFGADGVVSCGNQRNTIGKPQDLSPYYQY